MGELSPRLQDDSSLFIIIIVVVQQNKTDSTTRTRYFHQHDPAAFSARCRKSTFSRAGAMWLENDSMLTVGQQQRNITAL